MNYQPISDPAQLQLLEGLARMFLHGVLIAIAVASVFLLCLCLAPIRLAWRRPSEVEAHERRGSADPLLAARRGESLYSLTPIRLWDTNAELSGGSLPEPTTPARRLGPSERGQRWSERVSLLCYLTVGLSLLGLAGALPVVAAAPPPAPDELLWYQDRQGLGQIQIETAGALDPLTGGYRVNVRIIRNCQISSGTGYEILLQDGPSLGSGSSDYLIGFVLQDFSGCKRLFWGRLVREVTAEGVHLHAHGEYQLMGADGDREEWTADSAEPPDLPAPVDAAADGDPS